MSWGINRVNSVLLILDAVLFQTLQADPQTDQLWEGELADQSHHSGTHPERTIGLSGACTCLPR